MKLDIETRLLGYTLLIIVVISISVVAFLMSISAPSIYTFIGIISAVILLGALMAKPVAASFTNPIKTMLEGTRIISQGYFDTHIPLSRRDEIGELASAINQLGQNLTQYENQRAQAEKELRHSEQRFKDFAESTSDWFWETDAELRYTWLSDNVHTILQTLGGDRYPKSVCNGIYVNRAVFSPHGDVVATASHDQIIRLWRVADGSLLASLTGHALIITELAFSPDGRLLASSAEDGEVRLWSMATYEPVRTLPPHASGAASLTFSPNGKTLATADGAGRLHLWRVADGQPLWTVDSGKNYHSNLTFSPDGSLLAAGADDEQLHFWATQDGALRYTLSGPLAEVKRVAFSPDGRQVAAGSVDGTVRLWAIPGRSEAQAVGLKGEAD
jgi:WD40 repeat protein